MIRYATLKKKPKELLALTGLVRQEIEELLPIFEQALKKPPKAPKRRKRGPGGGAESLAAHGRGPVTLHSGLCEDLSAASGASRVVWDKSTQCQPLHSAVVASFGESLGGSRYDARTGWSTSRRARTSPGGS